MNEDVPGDQGRDEKEDNLAREQRGVTATPRPATRGVGGGCPPSGENERSFLLECPVVVVDSVFLVIIVNLVAGSRSRHDRSAMAAAAATQVQLPSNVATEEESERREQERVDGRGFE